MRILASILISVSASAAGLDFQYTDGLFGTYHVLTTAKLIRLSAGQRVVTIDVKKCNQKLIDVYLKRVRTSLGQLKPSARKEISNRVVMKGKTWRVMRKTPAAPFFRNLPSETYYLSRIQADACKSGRVPSSEEMDLSLDETWKKIYGQ